MKRALIHAPDRNAPNGSQAELSPDAIHRLIQSVGAPGQIEIVAANTSIVPTEATLSLRFIASPAPSKMQPIMDINIHHCLTSDMAVERMKDYLRGMTIDGSSDSIGSPRELIGNYALQTTSSILWVRDSIFISIDSAGGAPTVRLIAQKIDQYIIESSTASGMALKPNPVPSPTFPRTINVGQRAELKIDNVENTHALKRVLVEDSELAFQVSNGTEDGQYTLFARRPGTTNLKFTFAHSKNLSIRSIDVPITIVVEANPPDS